MCKMQSQHWRVLASLCMCVLAAAAGDDLQAHEKQLFIDSHHALLSATSNTTSASVTNITSAAATTAHPDSTVFPQWAGYIGAVVAIFFFGTNFIPVKKFETGDGLFYQFIMCVSIWCVGLIISGIRGVPPFYPIVMLGGAMWCTGNMCCIPIIKCIGLGIGMLIWGSFNLLTGWASGRFGWFGIKKEIPYHEAMNYIGVSLSFLSCLIYMCVDSRVSDSSSRQQTEDAQTEEWSPLLQPSAQVQFAPQPDDSDWTARLTSFQKRVVGVLLAIFAGLLFGLNFLPAIYCMDNYPDASPHGLDYVFAHFCGVLACSCVYFFVYCAVKKNQPHIYPRTVLPAVCSGSMWAVAQSGWFVANEALSEPVSFPIITTGPGLVAAFCGIILFKEIQGRRNYLILILAFFVTVAGAVLCGLSKDKNLRL